MVTGKVIAGEFELADNFWRIFNGLMFKGKFNQGEAMLFGLIDQAVIIYTGFFVKFPLDLVYSDLDLSVVEIMSNLGPWRFHSSRTDLKFFIEHPAGTIHLLGVDIGHKLALGKELLTSGNE